MGMRDASVRARPSTVRTARPSASTARYVHALTASAVHEHGARAAHLAVARALGALQLELVTQHVEQERVRGHVEVARAPVHEEADRLATPPRRPSRDHRVREADRRLGAAARAAATPERAPHERRATISRL